MFFFLSPGPERRHWMERRIACQRHHTSKGTTDYRGWHREHVGGDYWEEGTGWVKCLSEKKLEKNNGSTYNSSTIYFTLQTSVKKLNHVIW